jgi:hypothetical protein
MPNAGAGDGCLGSSLGGYPHRRDRAMGKPWGRPQDLDRCPPVASLTSMRGCVRAGRFGMRSIAAQGAGVLNCLRRMQASCLPSHRDLPAAALCQGHFIRKRGIQFQLQFLTKIVRVFRFSKPGKPAQGQHLQRECKGPQRRSPGFAIRLPGPAG